MEGAEGWMMVKIRIACIFLSHLIYHKQFPHNIPGLELFTLTLPVPILDKEKKLN